MKRATMMVAVVAAAGLACGERPAPPPSAAPSGSPITGEAPPLRPLTSREDGARPPIRLEGPAAVNAADAVAGTIAVDARVKGRLRPADVLFVVARDAERRIVAVRREGEVRFPFTFTISGADAMTEGTKFTGPLEITARLSRSGDAIPAPGDLEGVARDVRVGARDVKVSLDTVRQ